MERIDTSQTKEIYTVSRLNREVKLTLEGTFPFVWVEGEISNFVCPSSGHWYFALKDPLAQVRCAMFKIQNRRISFIPKDGMQVLVKTQVSLYEGRGDFQLIIDYMEESGIGRLRQAFEALKNRLHLEGLFNSLHKKTLPYLPSTIGIVTSPTGAAIRDVLSVLKRRFPCANIIIYPSMVQGDAAAATIAAAISRANERNECDVLLITRGGGSLEDLWPFNEERVAYAIHQSVIPIISGVGHEIDFTIADFVADVRAPTPSAAAELISPPISELNNLLVQRQKQLLQHIQKKLLQFQHALLWNDKALKQQHPKHQLAEKAQRLDLAELTLKRLQTHLILAYKARLQTLGAELSALTPKHQIREQKNRLAHYAKAFNTSISRSIQFRFQTFRTLVAKLDALSPLSTLHRGYSITMTTKNNKILLKAKEAQAGDIVHIQLSEGSLHCEVQKVND